MPYSKDGMAHHKSRIVLAVSLTAVLAGLLVAYVSNSNGGNSAGSSSSTTTTTTPPINSSTSIITTTTTDVASDHCHLQNGNSLPDPKCTPGALNPAVSQDNIQQTICVPGYSKTVRPSVSYTDAVKDKVMARYNLAGTIAKKDIELDHLIPLELGGNPTSEQNLWPEPRLHTDATYPAASKDVLENYYHRQVCDGKISLSLAQYAMASGSWINGAK